MHKINTLIFFFQGALDCCVYFRPKLLSAMRRRRRKRRLAAGGSSQKSSSWYPFSSKLWQQSGEEQQNAGNTSTENEDETYDPSVAIAQLEYLPETSTGETEPPGVAGGTMGVGLDAIQEELDQLEEAEGKIEEYYGE